MTGHPAAKITFACVNGAAGGNVRRITWFMDEGMRPGASDVLCLYPSPRLNGPTCLAIEFKKPGGRLRPNQRDFLASVQAAGGMAVVMTDAEKAFRLWAWYVGLTAERPVLDSRAIPD